MLFLSDSVADQVLLLYFPAGTAYHIAGGGGRLTSLFPELRVSSPFGKDSVRRFGMV